jgi:renalase
VVVAVPAPQALALAEAAGEGVDGGVRAELGRVRYDPCLAVLARLGGAAPGWRAIASAAGPLQWVGLESSKRASSGPTLVLHGSADWSRANEGLADGAVVEALGRALADVAGPGVGTLLEAQVKRWRYARPTLLAASRALLSERPPVVFCGDWAVAPRVEGAFLSGLAAAERLIGAGHA